VKPQRHRRHRDSPWLALEIGNSRLHWGLFRAKNLDSTWDTDHFPDSTTQQLAKCQNIQDLPSKFFPPGVSKEISKKKFPHTPIFLASVVPQQTELWQTHPHVRVITLEHIPLLNMYPTLGIDRALALWGAGKKWGFPMLVIDAGTALTFTGADTHHCLVGGAILPGLGLQFTTLNEKTGQLPQIKTPTMSLPPRFAMNTQDAIKSGIIYTLLASIKDFTTAWWQLYPKTLIVIKGGDAMLLLHLLQLQFPEIASGLIVEPNLTFWGIAEIVSLIDHPQCHYKYKK